MDFTKTIINAIKIWVNKQLSFIENKISDLEDRPSAFIQPEEPNEAPDGTLWIDTDEDSISGVGSNTAESLTFTGVVEATYNGLSPVTVNIPKVTVNGVTSDENGNIEIEVGSEQVQTDWNQNDSTQPDYIKNRTHWVEGSTYHTLNDNFIPETIARTSAVEEIKTLVGETPVSEQIEAAIAEIPEVEIPEQVQSDWNQTENTAVDYIKNRPFGEVDVTQTINMDTPSFTHYSGAYWTNSIVLEEQPGDNVKKLSVIWDDITYNDCNIVKIVRDNYIEYICGNGTIHQGIFGEHVDYKDLEEYTFEDTGEPFAIRFQSNVPMLAIYAYDEEADSGTDIVTKISIEITKTISKAIDEIYIPDTIARKNDIPEVPEQVNPDWNQNDSTQPDYVKNRTHYEEVSGTTIEWGVLTGNTDGRDSMTFPYGGWSAETYYKVSDVTPDISAFADSVLVIDNGENETFEIINKDSYNIVYDGAYSCHETKIVVVQNTTFTIEGTEYTAPSTGIYTLERHPSVGAYPISVTYNEAVIHTLDEKFIPDTIAKKSDIPEVNYPVTSVNGMTGDVVIEIPSVEGLATEEYVNEAIADISEGFSSSWNDLADKPFRVSGVDCHEIVWDGNIEGKDVFWIDEYMLYKVSDLTPSISDLIDGSCRSLNKSYTIKNNQIGQGDGVYFCKQDFAVVQNTECSIENMTIHTAPASTGIYFNFGSHIAHTQSLAWNEQYIHTIDEKYIPDTIARVSDIPEVPEINSPVTSVNGQTGDVQIEIPLTYTKEEIDNMEFITVDEIDAICGQTIQVASATSGTF